MSEEKDKSSPVPTKHSEEDPGNQSTEVERTTSNVKIITLIVLAIIILLVILAFAGVLNF